MRDRKLFFLSDATAAITEEVHNAALINLALVFADVRTTEEMLAPIDAGAVKDGLYERRAYTDAK